MGNSYSDDRLKKLKPLHKVVARELAMGIPLRDICEARGLNKATWSQITNCELFLQEVQRIQAQVEDEEIDDFVRDPVRLKLRTARMVAANRLVEEVDNFDKEETGATSQSRLTAAKTILEVNGDLKSHEDKAPTLIIQLAESVLNTVMNNTQNNFLGNMPKNFTLSEAPSAV